MTEQVPARQGEAFSYAGRAVLITGVREGIGGAIAATLARAGAELVLANRSVEAAQAVAGPLRAQGATVHVVPFGASEAQCRDTVRAALAATGGRLDVLAHNAGGCTWRALEDLDAEVLDATLALNLESCFWLVQQALPALKASASPRVVITSSVTGPRVAMVEAAHYAAAKAGVNGFIRAAALELSPHGITVNGVEPGLVAKDRGRLSQPDTLAALVRYIPLGRAGRPEDVASAVRFLGSVEAAWITGQTIVVDGGSLLPESGAAMEALWAKRAQGLR